MILTILMKLPIFVTGTLVHGHGDVRYAYYGIDLFADDSSLSFAKILQDLEMPPKSSSRRLFDGSRSTPMFQAVLHGAELYKTSLPPLVEISIPSTPLPPILNVQMDKNWFVFCFWSLLVANGIFKVVYVNFM
jgi:hypothetical protein